MTTYLVTGATGFLGRHLVERLLARPDAEVHILVRDGSQERLAELIGRWPDGHRVTPVVGEVTEPLLGIGADGLERLTGHVDHVVHVAALYDMTAGTRAAEQVNVVGTRHVVGLANTVQARCLHHVSSMAVAGDFRGRFTENMFEVGQRLPSPYHATKFAAERLVRERSDVPWRIYRPSVIVGRSDTGEMDKVDGPYYFFPLIARLRALPSWLPLAMIDLGHTNIVPVDFVADAMDHLIHEPDMDHRAFHLVSPGPQRVVDVYNAFARAAGAPEIDVALDRRLMALPALTASVLGRLPGAGVAGELVAGRLGIPPQVLAHMSFEARFSSRATREALAHTGLTPPELDDYADVLWAYWERALDPDRARRPRPGGPLIDRTVIVTGASSGIGRATALQVAREGGIPLLVARSTDQLEDVRREIGQAGGRAYVYPCDLTSHESVAATVKQMLADHDGVDMLVNNAGRSIRRSVKLSYDRMHDYERTMAVNYFGPVRLVLALLPHMTERRFGHIVNVSSMGVQVNPPRFSAYVASKAALDAFSRVVASETYGDHVTFTTIHMPLVRTPMIRPTRIYDAFPAISPEQAAGLVVRALKDKPKHVGTRLGTLAEVSYAIAPKVVDALLHTAFRVFPDSAAAGGGADLPADGPEAALSRGALAMARLLPGVHW